jgi:glycosidase
MNSTTRIIFAVIVIACLSFSDESNNIFENYEIAGLATPVTLPRGTSEINLADFFKDPSKIDHVFVEYVENFVLDNDKQSLSVMVGDSTPHLFELKVWINKTCYSILLKKAEEIPYQFSFKPVGISYKSVNLSGDMNGWKPEKNPMDFINGQWIIKLMLQPGIYQYRFIADGTPVLDPSVTEKSENPEGGLNSVITVGTLNSQDLPKIFSVKYKDNVITIGSRNRPDKYFILWQNFHIDPDKKTTGTDMVSFTIPQQAGRFQRSFIRVWSYNNNGVSNDLLIPLEFGKVVNNTEQLTRNDLEASVIYSIIIDRFLNANPINDRKVNDPRIEERVNFYGGDIPGIIKILSDGYFDELGVSTLLISPVVQNPAEPLMNFSEPRHWYTGYEGYWPQTLTSIDSGLGKSTDLHKMITLAHEKKMNVLLDFTAHHVYETNNLLQAHPDWATYPDLPDGTRNIQCLSTNPLTTWFETYLPTWNLSEKDVADAISDSASFWIQKYDFDGLYNNDMTYVSDLYQRKLTGKLLNRIVIPENRRLLKIGKTTGNRRLLSAHTNYNELDGQLELTGNNDANRVFALNDQSFATLNNSLLDNFYWFGHHNLMVNITGDQDLLRFISYAGESVPFDMRDKEMGWREQMEVVNPIGYKKLSMLTAYIMTIPGVPLLYYGDEIGLPGTFRPDNQRPMKWDKYTPEEENLRQVVSTLIHLRRSSLPLIYGDFESIQVDENTWVYIRTYFDKIAIMVMNKDATDRSVEFQIPERFEYKQLKAAFNSSFAINKTSMLVKMQPCSFEVLTN